MAFDVKGAAYNRFMGRYSEPLADRHVAWLGLQPGQRALDVGCGPGALTRRLAEALGPAAVAAVDPSEQFVDAARERLPEVDIRIASAERLPFPDGVFDHVTAQLVVHFMSDPIAGLAEMARVARVGGWVSASTWDLAGGRAPLSPLWQAARTLDSQATDESGLPGARERDLARLATAAGLTDIDETELVVTVGHPTFEDWWEPFTFGVGPSGDYVRSLDEARRLELREACRAVLPPAPFELTSVAWAVRGRAQPASMHSEWPS